MSLTDHPELPDADLGSYDFWGRPPTERDEYFAALREHAPLSRHEPPEDLLGMPDQDRAPYWAIVRFEDIRRISRDPATFCSGQGVQFPDAPPELLEASQSFLAMDAPRHTKLRGLVSAAFTPRQVARIEDGIRVSATADRAGGRTDRRRRLRRADRQAAATGDDLRDARRTGRRPRPVTEWADLLVAAVRSRVLRRALAAGGARRRAVVADGLHRPNWPSTA